MVKSPIPPASGPPVRPSGKGASRFTAGAALLLAVLALFVAVIAVGVSVIALSSADDAQIAAGEDGPAPTGQPAAVEPTTRASEPADDGFPDPSADYRRAYGPEALRVPPGCPNGVDVDLDEPRVADPGGAELRYTGCTGGSTTLTPSAEIKMAATDQPISTARECVETLRASSVANSTLPRSGTWLCAMTSAEAANQEGITQKLVAIEIQQVANDGTLTLSVMAWNVPL